MSVGHPNTIVLSVDGSDKGFHWNQQEPNVYRERAVHGRADGAPAQPCGHGPEIGLDDGAARRPCGRLLDAFRNMVMQIWAGFRGETSGDPDLADGLRGLVLVEAAVKSAQERRSIEVA